MAGLATSSEQALSGPHEEGAAVGGSNGPQMQMVSSGGHKTATNKRQETHLKLINTDTSQLKDKIPAPMHSQQYKSGYQKFDMLREHLNLKGQKLNLSDISEYNANNMPQTKQHHQQQNSFF